MGGKTTDEWMDGWMGGKTTDEWMDGWVDR